MGHSLGNCGQITMRYISPYTIEDRLNYNRILLKVGQASDSSIDERQSVAVFSPIDPNKQAIVEKLNCFSEQDLKEALIMLKRKELARLEAEL